MEEAKGEVFVGQVPSSAPEDYNERVDHAAAEAHHAKRAEETDRLLANREPREGRLAFRSLQELLASCKKHVSRDGLQLEHMSKSVKENRSVVEAAVRSNPLALQYASPELQNDKAMLALAWEGAVNLLDSRKNFGGAEPPPAQASAELHQTREQNRLKFIVESGGPLDNVGERSVISDMIEKTKKMTGPAWRANNEELGQGPSFLLSDVGGVNQEWPISREWQWGARTSARRRSIKKLAFTYVPVNGRKVIDPLCPEGHTLEDFHPRGNYFCDNCKTKTTADMHGCRICDFDLCHKCFERERGVFKTEDGQLSGIIKYRNAFEVVKHWTPTVSDFNVYDRGEDGAGLISGVAKRTMNALFSGGRRAYEAEDCDVSSLLHSGKPVLQLHQDAFVQCYPSQQQQQKRLFPSLQKPFGGGTKQGKKDSKQYPHILVPMSDLLGGKVDFDSDRNIVSRNESIQLFLRENFNRLRVQYQQENFFFNERYTDPVKAADCDKRTAHKLVADLMARDVPKTATEQEYELVDEIFGGEKKSNRPWKTNPLPLGHTDNLWMEALVHSASPIRAEIVAVHCDSETGLKSLDVSYEPRVPGGPFEFEPSVEVDRCSDFEIADSRPDVDTCFLKPEDFDLERIEMYLRYPTVKVFAMVSFKHLSSMLRALGSAGLKSFSYASSYSNRSKNAAVVSSSSSTNTSSSSPSSSSSSLSPSSSSSSKLASSSARSAMTDSQETLWQLIGGTLFTKDTKGDLQKKTTDEIFSELNGCVQSSGEQQKVVGLYFSAAWCPPCHAFTPVLKKAYEEIRHKQKKPLEIVFVSSDRNDNEFKDYFSHMPWLALPNVDENGNRNPAKNNLCERFKITGIPTLILINPDTCQIINMDGRSAVTTDKSWEEFPWREKTPLELLGSRFMRSEKVQDMVSYLDQDGRKCEFKYKEFDDGTGRKVSRLCFFVNGEDRIHGVTKVTVKTLGNNGGLRDQANEGAAGAAPPTPREGTTTGEDQTQASRSDHEGTVVVALEGTWVASVEEQILTQMQTRLPPVQSSAAGINEGKKGSEVAEYILALPLRGRRLKAVDDALLERLDNRVLLLYFGAPHWCAPCRAFSQPKPDRTVKANMTDQLMVSERSELERIYETLKNAPNLADPFELVYCCMGEDIDSFDDFATEFPGLILPFQSLNRSQALASAVGIMKIPSLVVLSQGGKMVLNRDAMFAASHETSIENFPWVDKNLFSGEAQEVSLMRETEQYRITIIGASRQRLEAFANANSVNFSAELDPEKVRSRCEKLYEKGQMADFMARVHAPSRALNLTAKAEFGEELMRDQQGNVVSSSEPQRKVTHAQSDLALTSNTAASDEMERSAAAGRYERVSTAKLHRLLARDASPATLGGRAGGLVGGPATDEDFMFVASSLTEAALLRCHLHKTLTGRRTSLVINPMAHVKNEHHHHYQSTSRLLLYKKSAAKYLASGTCGDMWKHCSQYAFFSAGFSEIAYFLVSNAAGNEYSKRWLKPALWRLCKVTVKQASSQQTNDEELGHQGGSDSSSNSSIFFYTMDSVAKLPRLAVKVEYLPLERLFDLKGSSLNDENIDLYEPFELLRAPYEKPTRTQGRDDYKEQRKHRNKDLFLPLNEMNYMELFRQLIEATPFKTLEEAQGCGFDVRALHEGTDRDARQCEAFFFLHKNNSASARAQRAASRFGSGGFSWKDIEALKSYFGEEMGFYFLFGSHYCCWLRSVALLGISCWVAITALRYDQANSMDAMFIKATFHMTLATVGLFWASAMLHDWARKETQVSFLWNPATVSEAPARPAYHGIGVNRHSPISGRLEKYFPSMTRKYRQLFSASFTLLFALIVMAAIIAISSMQDRVVQDKKDNNGDSSNHNGLTIESAWDRFVIRYLPLIANVIVVEAAKFLYHRIAFVLTEYENYRSSSEHNRALFLKLMLFDFFDDYFPLYFIAFAKPNCPYHAGCTEELTVQVFLLLVLNNCSMRLFSSLVLPHVTIWTQKKMKGVSTRDENKFDPIEQQFVDMLRFDPSEDFANEALELIQQFGYVVLFGSAFPFCYALAYGTNLFDLLFDAKKLLRSYRRVAPRQVSELCFDDAFRFLLYLAIPTNVALVIFTYSELGDDDGNDDSNDNRDGGLARIDARMASWAFFIAVILLAGAEALATVVLGAERQDKIRIQTLRNQFIVERAVHETSRAETAGLSEEAILLESLEDLKNGSCWQRARAAVSEAASLRCVYEPFRRISNCVRTALCGCTESLDDNGQQKINKQKLIELQSSAT